MNHSYISLAERTRVLLKHMNAGEHRDWHMSLVRRALLTNTVYPCVEASPHRQPQPSRSSTVQRGDHPPRKLLWVGAAGRGKAKGAVAQQGLQAVHGAACQTNPLVLGCTGNFCGAEWSVSLLCAAGRGAGGVGWHLILAKDAG